MLFFWFREVPWKSVQKAGLYAQLYKFLSLLSSVENAAFTTGSVGTKRFTYLSNLKTRQIEHSDKILIVVLQGGMVQCSHPVIDECQASRLDGGESLPLRLHQVHCKERLKLTYEYEYNLPSPNLYDK